jgi:hypothetical protein
VRPIVGVTQKKEGVEVVKNLGRCNTLKMAGPLAPLNPPAPLGGNNGIYSGAVCYQVATRPAELVVSAPLSLLKKKISKR